MISGKSLASIAVFVGCWYTLVASPQVSQSAHHQVTCACGSGCSVRSAFSSKARPVLHFSIPKTLSLIAWGGILQ